MHTYVRMNSSTYSTLQHERQLQFFLFFIVLLLSVINFFSLPYQYLSVFLSHHRTHTHSSFHTHTCTHIHAHTYMHTHACTHIRAHTYLCTHTHICIYIHTHTHTHIYIYTHSPTPNLSDIWDFSVIFALQLFAMQSS